MNAIQVGLLGMGTVGSGTFAVLRRNQAEIMRRAGRGIAIIMVADLDTAAAFYATVFGLAETARVSAEIAGRPIDEIMYGATGAGGATFVLLRFADQPTPAHDEVILGFIVAGIDALVERAVAAGGAIAQAPTDMVEHGMRVGFITDPEGHLIELVEPFAAT